MFKPDVRNIEHDTLENKYYRKVIYTLKKMFQLVLMTLNPGEDIPMETHRHTTQFIRVEKGKGIAVLGKQKRKYLLKDGVSVTIPMNTPHYIKNTSRTQPLQLYTIYVPPEHSPKTHTKRQFS